MHSQRRWGWLNSSSPPVGFQEFADSFLTAHRSRVYGVYRDPFPRGPGEDSCVHRTQVVYVGCTEISGLQVGRCWPSSLCSIYIYCVCRLDSHHYFRCDVCDVCDVCVCVLLVFVFGIECYAVIIEDIIYIIQMYIFYIWTQYMFIYTCLHLRFVWLKCPELASWAFLPVEKSHMRTQEHEEYLRRRKSESPLPAVSQWFLASTPWRYRFQCSTTRWWQLKYLLFSPWTLGKWSNLTCANFSDGWRSTTN